MTYVMPTGIEEALRALSIEGDFTTWTVTPAKGFVDGYHGYPIRDEGMFQAQRRAYLEGYVRGGATARAHARTSRLTESLAVDPLAGELAARSASGSG